MCFKIRGFLMIKDSRLFKKWPVEYRWVDPVSSKSTLEAYFSSSTIVPNYKVNPALQDEDANSRKSSSVFQAVRRNSSKCARYVLAHSVGRCLLYPGSVCLLNKVSLSLLVHGRRLLMEEFHGKRAKLIARDGNEIDTMFVDRRRKKTAENQGMRLVICCEGNGSFYEVGCIYTPLRAGYSILGWNHPGFGRSTGKPYPQNDINAMDVVLQYAVCRLHFPLPDIVIYGYSLGSYTATWAAMAYPELGALVLDASFDSLVPLAMKVLGGKWKGLVWRTVIEHFNLNVAEMLCQYQGPVLLIRRTLDEVTSTQFDPKTSLPIARTNRTNELLLQLLHSRYPNILDGEEEAVYFWLSADSPPVETLIYRHFYKVDDKWCLQVLENYKASLGPNCAFPWDVGEDLVPSQKQELALFLAKKHLKNVETTHGRNLPPEEFELPWKL
ncbi:protein ABHD16B-like [Anolis carolinensis]|nr:PREDICTED: protein ABHD16B-like [Anolis carolinensis]|eukprot:XP_003220742.2 PREDICTED: protein ABHD16B-like [Anolis carolinensis]